MNSEVSVKIEEKDEPKTVPKENQENEELKDNEIKFRFDNDEPAEAEVAEVHVPVSYKTNNSFRLSNVILDHVQDTII